MADLTKREASGMTVNERLLVTGSMAAFNEAVARKDRVRLREILGRLFLAEADIEGIIDHVLLTG
jgi:hypothetical protein